MPTPYQPPTRHRHYPHFSECHLYGDSHIMFATERQIVKNVPANNKSKEFEKVSLAVVFTCQNARLTIIHRQPSMEQA